MYINRTISGVNSTVTRSSSSDDETPKIKQNKTDKCDEQSNSNNTKQYISIADMHLKYNRQYFWLPRGCITLHRVARPQSKKTSSTDDSYWTEGARTKLAGNTIIMRQINIVTIPSCYRAQKMLFPDIASM